MRASVSVCRMHALSRSRARSDEPIAGRVPERVIDALEAVEVEQEDGDHAIAATQPGERIVEPLAQQLAVRQVRERIVEREVAGPPLGHDLRRDVAGDATIAKEAADMVEGRLAGEAQDAAPAGAVLDLAKEVAEGLPCIHDAAQIDDALRAASLLDQLAERVRQEFLRRERHHFGEALREKDDAPVGIGLPDPVRARVGDVAEAGLARPDGEPCLACVQQDETGEARDQPEGEQERGQDVTDELPPQGRRLPGEPAEARAVRGAQRQHGLGFRLRRDGPQIGEPEALRDRLEQVAIEKLGVDQDGACPGGRIDRLGRLRRDRAGAEHRDDAIEHEVARDRAGLVAWDEARHHDQIIEPGRQLKRIRGTVLAIDRHVARAIVATDDDGHVVVEGLVDIAADVVVRPGEVEVEIKMADRRIPPGIVLRSARDLLGLRADGATDGARGLLLRILCLPRRAVADEGDDGQHRRCEQRQDRKRHLPREAVGLMSRSLESSSGQGYCFSEDLTCSSTKLALIAAEPRDQISVQYEERFPDRSDTQKDFFDPLPGVPMAARRPARRPRRPRKGR